MASFMIGKAIKEKKMFTIGEKTQRNWACFTVFFFFFLLINIYTHIIYLIYYFDKTQCFTQTHRSVGGI